MERFGICLWFYELDERERHIGLWERRRVGFIVSALKVMAKEEK